jgi:hypothetical protein
LLLDSVEPAREYLGTNAGNNPTNQDAGNPAGKGMPEEERKQQQLHVRCEVFLMSPNPPPFPPKAKLIETAEVSITLN